MVNPYQITRDFEMGLCEYTGAPFAVALNSCSAALLLSALWWKCDYSGQEIINEPSVFMPSRTYVSAPMAFKLAGYDINFEDEYWRGAYQIKPTNIWDCARRFTSGMFRAGQFQCASFAAAKILGIEQGGAILHDDAMADKWLRRMRFDGRTEGVNPPDDTFDICGYHCLMLPSIAAQALLRLHHLPKHNADQDDYPYPDLSKHPAFK